MLANPSIVTISFEGDPYQDEEEAWLDWVIASSWFPTVAAEYGVSAISVAARVRLAESAPSTFDEGDVVAWLAPRIGGSLPSPAPSLLYLIYFPAGVALTYRGEGYCDGAAATFSGYHTEVELAGSRQAVAIVGRCPMFWSGLDELENVERTASHEILEAVTDPFVVTNPAYHAHGDARDDQAALDLASGGEIGDTCHGSLIYADGGFVAQRIWSNAAASSGGDPCVPTPNAPFFEVTTDTRWHGVDAGGSVSVDLYGWSKDTVDDWIVRSRVGDGLAGFTVETTATTRTPEGYATVNSGRNVVVTITAPATATSGAKVGIAIRSMTSSANASPDTSREAEYHEFPIGIFVN